VASDPFAGIGLNGQEDHTKGTHDAGTGEGSSAAERRLSRDVAALLSLQSRAGAALRARERGWDWDVAALPENIADPTRTIDKEIADKEAQVAIAEMVKLSRAIQARHRKNRA